MLNMPIYQAQNFSLAVLNFSLGFLEFSLGFFEESKELLCKPFDFMIMIMNIDIKIIFLTLQLG
jgi:hypothetical protein